VTYEADIRPIFEANCVSCHGATNPAANYSMASYEEVLGNGSDGVPNAIPGDVQSLLLQKSLTTGSMNAYYDNLDEVTLVERWVVEDSLVRQ
jgi:mono/diheme cytochrome c family protein